MQELTIDRLLNLDETIAGELFLNKKYPWEILPDISAFTVMLGKQLSGDEFLEIKDQVWVHKTAKIAETACINGPLIIDKNAEIRHCAYIRGSVVVGANAVVGNSSEVKNSILFNFVQVPHYNYVGDSILGFHSHMGAGAVTSNLKSDHSPVCVHAGNQKFETGLKKMGAVLGDYAEIGCNSVLNPGTVIGKHSTVYPASMVRGYVKENSIYKCKTEIADKY